MEAMIAAERLGIPAADRDAFALLVTRMQTPAAHEAELQRIRAELTAVNDALRAAGIEYPRGSLGVQDLATQRDGAHEALDEATAALARIRELHQPADITFARGPLRDEGETRDVRYLRKCCNHCVDDPYAMPVDWPCPTIQALDGTIAPEHTP